MLIINIKNEELKREKKTFLRKKRRDYEVPFTRNSIKIADKDCTLLEFNSENIDNVNLEKLLKIYKGRILASNDVMGKYIPEKYRFDCKPYFKRAVMSALATYIENSNNKNVSLCIRDSNFRLFSEAVRLAKISRNLIIISEENINTQKFSDYCFLQFGTLVKFKKISETYSFDIYLNLDEIDESGKVWIKIDGKDSILYPDPEYFRCDSGLNNVLSYGIPIKIACAAFEIKHDKEINWCSEY